MLKNRIYPKFSLLYRLNMSTKYSDIKERLQIVVDKKTTNELAHLTHYFQNHKNGISQYFKPSAAEYLTELHDELNIVEERTVGPDLGADSIKSGTFSLIIGFLLVILFMTYKYRIFGIIANISLITNLLMLVGILTILEATLTLPGIAGIILTVGMAVDANVLIFERIREELKTEKSLIHAFDIGYNKAKITVLDANITTLLAAIILFAFGSGPIKGFAITLGIGILTTLFSAYFIARHLTSWFVLKNKTGSINL